MLRRLAIALVLLAPAVSLVAPASVAARTRPPALVVLTACATGPAAGDRFAVFEGRMGPARGAVRLRLRFSLRMQGADGAWRPVAGEGLGTWNTAAPGVRGYVYAKRVERLPAPATFRMLVEFRWQDARGRVVDAARRGSPPCRQPDLRPNLLPVAVSGPAPGRYRVRVRNAGRGHAGPFSVSVSTAGGSATGTAAGLAAGAASAVEATGPPCPPGTPLRIRVDASGTIEERAEDDNVLVVPCPGPPGAPPLE